MSWVYWVSLPFQQLRADNFSSHFCRGRNRIGFLGCPHTPRQVAHFTVFLGIYQCNSEHQSFFSFLLQFPTPASCPAPKNQQSGKDSY